MAYQLKLVISAAAIVVVVAGGILGAWAYLELEHNRDQKQLLDCIRSETVADAQEPAMQVVEASILECQP